MKKPIHNKYLILFVFLSACVAYTDLETTPTVCVTPTTCTTQTTLETNTPIVIPEDPILKLLEKGEKLSQDEADKIEQKLVSSPDDVETRLILLGYYSLCAYKSESCYGRFQPHYHWLIEHDPASVAFLYLHPLRFPAKSDAYAKASALWKKQAESHSQEPLVLANAAHFFWKNNLFFTDDKRYGLTFFEAAEKLDPNNSEWKWQLGRLHYEKSKVAAFKEDRAAEARKALTKFEESYKLNQKSYKTTYYLRVLARTAFAAEEWKKAENYAKELLAITEKSGYRDRWYGDAIYDGNLVLGRLALHQSDINAAKTYLLAAGKTGGSTYLNTEGPDMSLAGELLEVGERETVLAFFEECAVFWKTDKLDTWKAIILANETPSFGSHVDVLWPAPK
jgi:hypothetical protein